MKAPKELKKRCQAFFNQLNNTKSNYYLILDKETKKLYKIKIIAKHISFLAVTNGDSLLNQLKDLFPDKDFNLGNADFKFINIFNKHNKIILGIEKSDPDLIMWNRGIYEI